MTKHAIAFFCLTIINCGCNNQATENKTIAQKTAIVQDTTLFKDLYGTWLRQNKQGCTFIEIKDTSNVLYYQFIDRKADNDTITSDKYWYYKSNCGINVTAGKAVTPP